MKEAFISSSNLIKFSEETFRISSIEGKSKSTPVKEFKDLERWRMKFTINIPLTIT